MDAYLIDAVRTPSENTPRLSHIRTDDLAALPITRLLERKPVARPGRYRRRDPRRHQRRGRGQPQRGAHGGAVGGPTGHRSRCHRQPLCASGAEAVVSAGRLVTSGDAAHVLAGGVESMSRAPFVMPRPDKAFPRSVDLLPTQVGWRMVNPRMEPAWVKSLVNARSPSPRSSVSAVANRTKWAVRSHELAEDAWRSGRFDDRVMPVDGCGQGRKHPSRNKRRNAVGAAVCGLHRTGAVTAGNASPTTTVPPRSSGVLGTETTVHGSGSSRLRRSVWRRTILPGPGRRDQGRVENAPLSTFADIAVWENNEAFAAMVLSCLRNLPEITPESDNRQGGAIAYGHPLGAVWHHVSSWTCVISCVGVAGDTGLPPPASASGRVWRW